MAETVFAFYWVPHLYAPEVYDLEMMKRVEDFNLDSTKQAIINLRTSRTVEITTLSIGRPDAIEWKLWEK